MWTHFYQEACYISGDKDNEEAETAPKAPEGDPVLNYFYDLYKIFDFAEWGFVGSGKQSDSVFLERL